MTRHISAATTITVFPVGGAVMAILTAAMVPMREIAVCLFFCILQYLGHVMA